MSKVLWFFNEMKSKHVFVEYYLLWCYCKCWLVCCLGTSLLYGSWRMLGHMWNMCLMIHYVPMNVYVWVNESHVNVLIGELFVLIFHHIHIQETSLSPPKFPLLIIQPKAKLINTTLHLTVNDHPPSPYYSIGSNEFLSTPLIH